jgi:hypothetical protein
MAEETTMPLDLPKWKSHKVVTAAKIISIDVGTGRGIRTLTLGWGERSDRERRRIENPDQGIFARYSPKVGDYWVVYEDGYTSISPRAAFESGYRPEAGEHVFEGSPDARQSADVKAPVSRFRPTYRALTPTEKITHDAIKANAELLEALFVGKGPFADKGDEIPKNGDQARYRAFALTALEESVMWAVKALTA